MYQFAKAVSTTMALTILAAVITTTMSLAPAAAQSTTSLPPTSLYKSMLAANRQPGWVNFRNYNGRQWIYFTALQTLHCRLKQIRYSINSNALDKNFPVIKCNPHLPYSLPPNAGPKHIAINLPLGTAKTLTVSVTWDDGTQSEVAVYRPCTNVGDQSCALPMN